MKLKRIGILVAAAAMLVMMTGGSALALTYTWEQVDWSQLSSSTSANWYDNSEGNPTVAGNTNLYWQNTFANEYYGSSYYPTLYAIRDDGQDYCYYASPASLSYHYVWAPDGGDGGQDPALKSSTSSGSHYISVSHFWGTSRGGSNVNANVLHYYSV
jgi:hypothetical protein